MQIGIITVHDSANFGSFLQAYALQHVLVEMGHKVYFIRTRDDEYLRSLYYKSIISKKLLKHPLRTLREHNWGKQKYQAFTEEQKCFEMIETPDDEKLDLVIIGSDELWNVCTPVFRKPVFYGAGVKVPTIAYAISAGKAPYSELIKYKELPDLIKKIDKITVRDENTDNIVTKICGTKPQTVCDPTLLVKSDIFRKEYHNSYLEKNPYILIYSYSITPQMREAIIKFARKKGLKLVSACFYFDWCDYNFVCSPLDFCSVLTNASYVITTTFHGTIFSFLNHKEFISIPQSPKVNDVLHKVGLEHVIMSDSLAANDIDNHFNEYQIDYDAVENRLMEMRNESLEILKGMISQYGNNL